MIDLKPLEVPLLVFFDISLNGSLKFCLVYIHLCPFAVIVNGFIFIISIAAG